MTNRPRKGTSKLLFPKDYVVLDLETTGLRPMQDEIIEIAALRYKNNEYMDRFTTLVRPRRSISPFITGLTGIDNELVKDAPRIEECLPALHEFLGNDLIVGYNVNFDINFLYDFSTLCMGRPLSNDFVDVLRIARIVLPFLPHHRQTDVASYYNIDIEGAHRAEKDCLLCAACLNELKNEIRRKGQDPDHFPR